MIPLEIQLETEPQLVDGPTRLSPSHSTTNPPGQHLSARPLKQARPFTKCQFANPRHSADVRASVLVVRRGFVCVVECCLCSFDFGEDWLGGFGPAEGFGVVVRVGGPVFYGVVELGDGGEGPSFEGFAGEYGEPGLDEVGPACAGGGEVEVPAFAVGVFEPFADGFGLVGGQVVQDDVDVEVAGGVQVDPLEEREHVFAGVAAAGLVQDLAGGDVEGGEQVQGAVALVVVGHCLGPAPLHWQRRLGAVQGLYLGLLVEAEHCGPLGRVQIQADHVAELGLEVRVLGQLEHIGAPRAQPALAPDARHDVFSHTPAVRHGPRRPARRPVGGLLIQRVRGDRRLRLGAQRPRRPPPPDNGAQPLQPARLETPPPCPHRVRRHPAPARRLLVGRAIDRRQQNPRLARHALRHRPRTRHALQLRPNLNRNHQRLSTHAHPHTLHNPATQLTTYH